METGITKQQLISELSRSPHAAGTAARGAPGQVPKPKPKFKHRTVGPRKGTGTIIPTEPVEKTPKPTYSDRLKEYLPVCGAGARQEPEFYAHLLSWNLAKGQVKDSRVALPVIALTASPTGALLENALAHMAALDPRLFLRALNFAWDLKLPTNMLKRLAIRYVRDREADRKAWDRTMLHHRQPMSALYKHRRLRIAPGDKPKGESYEWDVLNGVYEPDSAFAAVRDLKTMPMAVAAQMIAKHRISPLISLPALGSKAKDPDVLFELIKSMSPTELTTNMKLLEKLGVRNVPKLRAAMDEAFGRAATSKKATLKTTQAAKALDNVDEILAAQLRDVQEKQIKAVSTVDGDWGILGDRSGSMERSIETVRQAGSIMAASVKGRLYVAWFSASPELVDLTGKTYEDISALTRHVTANGNTSIGCALNALLVKKIRIDGIVLVSDGAENTAPYFVDVYKRYCEFVGKVPPIYFYRVPGQPDKVSVLCNIAGIEVTTYDIASSADYYSLPNLIAGMRVDHYSLLDEIMITPLLKLDDVLTKTVGMSVVKGGEKHVGSTTTVAR